MLEYLELGMDFMKSRHAILECAGAIQEPVLEAGCGSGYTTLYLARKGYDFKAVDIDRDALQKTAMNLAFEDLFHKVRLYCSDAADMRDFQDEEFRTIVCVDLVHHMDDREGLAAGLDRVLCSGGKIVMADLNPRGRRTVDEMHRREGRQHDQHPIQGREEMLSEFFSRGYSVKEYEEEFHWILVCRKGTA